MLRHRISPFVLGCFAACGGGGGTTPTPDAAPPDAPPVADRRLIILHTNDEHSHVFAFDPELDDFKAPPGGAVGLIGSVARRATVLANERAAAAAANIDVLTVSSGDATQGALPQVAMATSAPDFVLLERLGYDVLCPGNHEFDQGPKAYAMGLQYAIAHGGLPQVVSTNIHFNGETDLAALYGEGTSQKPIKRYHVITTASGIKVGFLGIMGADASYKAPLKTPITFSGAAHESDYAMVRTDIYADIQPTVDALRNTEKVDVVIALSHSGVNATTPALGDDYNIAQHVRGIDAIVSGHSHTALQTATVVAGPDGHDVPIVQAGFYGNYVGHLELVVHATGRPTLDAAKTHLIAVDESVAKTPGMTMDVIDGVIGELEGTRTNGKSYLERELSLITGTTVTDDSGMLGDLYFKEIAKTTFDVIGQRGPEETNVLNLATDAMLAEADALGSPVEVAIEARGTVRADIRKGGTGSLAFADLFRLFPLGQNPVDGSIGYPLVRAYIWTAELKAALELALSRGQADTDFYLGVAGVHVEFDMSRDPQVIVQLIDALNPENGRITKIVLDDNHADGNDNPTVVIFDLSLGAGAWVSGNPLDLHPVVSSLYVASFAAAAGATLKDAGGTSNPDITAFILKRPDQTAVKEFENFIAYVYAQAQANGGFLPSRYDETTQAGAIPRRMLCVGTACP